MRTLDEALDVAVDPDAQITFGTRDALEPTTGLGSFDPTVTWTTELDPPYHKQEDELAPVKFNKSKQLNELA